MQSQQIPCMCWNKSTYAIEMSTSLILISNFYVLVILVQMRMRQPLIKIIDLNFKPINI